MPCQMKDIQTLVNNGKAGLIQEYCCKGGLKQRRDKASD